MRLIMMLVISLMAGSGVVAQSLQLFTEKPDDKEKKFLYGILTKQQVTENPDFPWYAENAKYAKPQPDVVEAIKAGKSKAEIVMFIGTWCHDTQQLLPKYFKSLEAAEFSDEQLLIIGTDRAKHTLSNMHKVFNVHTVPTVIVLQDGKEVGRVSEYGETGLVDKELADIFRKLQ